MAAESKKQEGTVQVTTPRDTSSHRSIIRHDINPFCVDDLPPSNARRSRPRSYGAILV